MITSTIWLGLSPQDMAPRIVTFKTWERARAFADRAYNHGLDGLMVWLISTSGPDSEDHQ